jgi:hypothetical protein
MYDCVFAREPGNIYLKMRFYQVLSFSSARDMKLTTQLQLVRSSKMRSHFETSTCHGLVETKGRNDCAGEGEQQFNRPTESVSQMIAGVQSL